MILKLFKALCPVRLYDKVALVISSHPTKLPLSCLIYLLSQLVMAH